MSYDTSAPWLGRGQASGAQIQAWFESQTPGCPDIGDAIIDEAAAAGLNADLVAGQIALESGWWSSNLAKRKNNPAGLGAEDDDPENKGLSFPSPRAGIHAQCAHLLSYILGAQNPLRADDPRFSAMPAGFLGTKTTLGQFGNGVWATDPAYAGKLVDRANRLLRFIDANSGGGTMPQGRPFHVAISYGHNNTDGGDPFEITQTPKIGRAVRDACRALGMEVRVVQEEKDTGHIGLDGVAQTIVDWHNDGWLVDIYLETHTSADGRVPGVFGIFPDNSDTGDVDADARRIGIDAARRVSAATDVVVRSAGCVEPGAMSETKTDVGLHGSRLGIFRVTAPIRRHATRMIIEYGAHDVQSDIDKIMGNLNSVGQATAAAFAAEAQRLGFTTSDSSASPHSGTVVRIDPVTGKQLSGGFRGYVEFLESKLGAEEALMLIGRPLTNEVVEDGLTVQYFERARFEHHPGQRPPFDVLLSLLGSQALAAKGGQSRRMRRGRMPR